jgi:DNA mismatch repair protein MSH4
VAATGKSNASSARLASKGISALICIKSTLASIPLLASTLKTHLDRIDGKTGKENQQQQQKRNKRHETNNEPPREEETIATAKTSLLMGLGIGRGPGGSSSSEASWRTTQQQHQLLRAIVFALSQPDLEYIRETIDDAFTESTTFTRNAHAMKHQECFALKTSNDNGVMDVFRKVRAIQSFIGLPFISFCIETFRRNGFAANFS